MVGLVRNSSDFLTFRLNPRAGWRMLFKTGRTTRQSPKSNREAGTLSITGVPPPLVIEGKMIQLHYRTIGAR